MSEKRIRQRYCRDYGRENPELVENDIFRFILPLPTLEQVIATPEQATEQASEQEQKYYTARHEGDK